MHSPQYHCFESSVRAVVRYAGKTYKADQPIPIDHNSSRIVLSFTALEADPKAVVKFSFNCAEPRQTVEVPITFNFKEVPFQLVVLPGSAQSIHIDQKAPLELKIQGEPTHWPKRFWFQSPMGGVLTYEEKTYQSGDTIPISPGKSLLHLLFSPDRVGEQLNFYDRGFHTPQSRGTARGKLPYFSGSCQSYQHG